MSVGDGSSDVHVMLHVNRRDGFTIAVSEANTSGLSPKRSILREDTLSKVQTDLTNHSPKPSQPGCERDKYVEAPGV